MAYCTKCGKPNTVTARFCTSCGAALIIISAKEPQSLIPDATPAVVKQKYWPFLLIGAALILSAGAYIIFFNKGNKNHYSDIPAANTTENVPVNDKSPRTDVPDKSFQEGVSYTDVYGKLVFISDCYIIVTGSFADEYYARDYVNTMRNEGHPNSGYLWIPDYPSLSGKQFYATFIGPYQSYDECENSLRTLKVNSRFWYGKKVSYNPDQIEIRIK